jgi:bifunctional non-homologous end joining protein LigD
VSLKAYKAKRDFRHTREPRGKLVTPGKGKSLFVVQKHAARRLHYDFRLEMQGVLKSWAVPKGFPTQKGDRRLAVQVEDHPFDYAHFEGIIPEGNYGAGTVMVWDTGTYELLGGEPLEALRSGKLHLRLRGKKLDGEWTLVRMKRTEDQDKAQWLLLKTGADISPFSASAENQSVLSKRTFEQIAASRSRKVWQSDRQASSSAGPDLPNRRSAAARVPKGRSSAAKESSRLHVPKLNLPRLPKAAPTFIPPMKALSVQELPRGPQWIYEMKLDGVRALAIKRNNEVILVSRAANDLTAKFPELVAALRLIPAKQAVVDGEIVAVDAQGRSSFQLLQSYQTAGSNRAPLFYYVFDALNLDGKDLTGLPLLQRKALAEALIRPAAPTVRFSATIQAESKRVMREMQSRGLEGLIAKQKNSKYEADRRTGAWVKFKWTNEQEFVIGGYTRPQGARTHFGAILVGYYKGSDLFFAGKVGTGFNHRLLESLYNQFQKLVRPDCPFANLPEKLPGARHQGMTASGMKRCTWLEPKLVCQIRFAEWTRDHHLRQPAFLGLREDKKAREVVREEPG